MLKFVRYVLASAAALSIELAAEAEYVIPSGECVGVKMYTDGLMVIDTASVTDRSGNTVDIAAENGIEKGDIIKKVNGRDAVSNEMLADNLSLGSVTLTLSHDGNTRDIDVTPADTRDGPKLGLWLRDSTAGLGTITFYKDNRFAALGHGICDVDTGDIMPIGRGIIQDCTITSISKGKSGRPGAVTGNIDGGELGAITGNTESGLFGELYAEHSGTPVEVAERSEVKTGAAQILAEVDGGGVQIYSIEIKRVSPPIIGAKDLIVKVTDDRLISRTGGIVQGMSGAPILQNGKLVGAVTHVFVNDPLSGYGILAENMLKNE